MNFDWLRLNISIFQQSRSSELARTKRKIEANHSKRSMLQYTLEIKLVWSNLYLWDFSINVIRVALEDRLHQT